MVDPRVLVGTFFIAGCSVPVQIEKAAIDSVKDSTENEIAEYSVAVKVDKNGWRQIIKKQVYTYIHISNCQTGDVEYAVYPKLGGANAEDFDEMSKQLQSLSNDEIVLTGEFTASDDLLSKQHCITLDGGSYFLHKVRSNKIVAEQGKASAKTADSAQRR